ncbi:hypothetical protein E5329_13950 [Petralouisia muris]|uniref:Uncharacterized protein n=1 Tax=Petralouisia muris TaxID=3032872 RepID=A0AC61RUX1_9FIRM|nr:hypothetical protein [Petralouisia muris]TGY95667.1 hypothetical protein E5329_13950 [Petralouisia muris]
MGMNSVPSMNSMSSMHMITAASTEPKIKNIQNEITNVQQQMQKLSSKEELSIHEKTDERKKLQKEVFRLNTELKQHQEELRKSQKRKIMMAKLQEELKTNEKEAAEDKNQTKETSSEKANEKNLPNDKQQPSRQGTIILRNSDGTVILKDRMNQIENRGTDTDKTQDDEAKEESISDKETKAADSDTDIGLSPKKAHAIVSADASIQQANRLGAVIARTKDGIVILKGEMNQDEMRDVNTERTQDALEKMEKREQMATTFQLSVLGEANKTMKSALEINDVAGIKNKSQGNAEHNAFINAVRASQEEGLAAQQKFFLSFRD